MSISPSILRSDATVNFPATATVDRLSTLCPVNVRIVRLYVPAKLWSELNDMTPVFVLICHPSPLFAPASPIIVNNGTPSVVCIDLITKFGPNIAVESESVMSGVENVVDVSAFTCRVSSLSIVIPVAVPEIY